jgi:hypothetical protein
MIFDKANKYGEKTIVKKTTNPIWVQADKLGNHKLQDTQMVTNNATPSAYDIYMAP